MLLRFSVFAFGTMVLAFGCLEEPNRGGGSGGSSGEETGGISGGGGSNGGDDGLGGSHAGARGGAPSSGGKTNTNGGSNGNGGQVGSGGVSSGAGAGGMDATGGDAGAAGATEGGAESFGGAGGAGGAGAAGAEGGGAPDAGAAGSGGEGGAIEIGSSVYPFAAGPDDVTQPSGAAGNLKVLNWAGFKGAISYTFDDTNQSQLDHYADLQALGVRYTFYLQTNKSELDDPKWVQAAQDGHEIGNHTVHHLQESALNMLSNPGEELDLATAAIQSKIGVTPRTMASPYGQGSYIPLAKTRFFINRGVSGGLMLPNDSRDPFDLRCSIPDANADLSALNGFADTARSGGGWRVLLVHGFMGGVMDYAYNPVAFENFSASVTYVKSLGDMWIDSVVHVGAYWLGQRAFSAATKTTQGSATTWAWQLPDHFPRGEYLRVVVDGGTLKQGDTTLQWNSHGFYEVALDYKSLTLSP